jgi:hypothetical protein
MSRASRLVLEAEIETATRLEFLLTELTLDRKEMSNYQYLAVLVEVATLVARLRDLPTDQVFKHLSAKDRSILPEAINTLLGKNAVDLRQLAA